MAHLVQFPDPEVLAGWVFIGSGAYAQSIKRILGIVWICIAGGSSNPVKPDLFSGSIVGGGDVIPGIEGMSGANGCHIPTSSRRFSRPELKGIVLGIKNISSSSIIVTSG